MPVGVAEVVLRRLIKFGFRFLGDLGFTGQRFRVQSGFRGQNESNTSINGIRIDISTAYFDV